MAIGAEVIFVGLCTLVNVTNQNMSTDVPPASAVVMKFTDHKNFIAFDSGAVDVTGVTPEQLSTSRFSMIQFLPEGEVLTFNDDRTQPPTVLASFDNIAHFGEYSGFTADQLKAWDPTYIPKRNTLPKANTVAAYVEFGAGTISADRMTLRKYEFTVPGVDPVKERARCFAREVHYVYDAPGKGLLIEARSLSTNVKRTMLFTPKGSATKVQIWIGTSMNPLGDLQRIEPKKFQDGAHFAAFYKSDLVGDNPLKEPLPRPVPYDCDGKDAPLETAPAQAIAKGKSSKPVCRKSKRTDICTDCGEGDPSVGYCGPESKP